MVVWQQGLTQQGSSYVLKGWLIFLKYVIGFGMLPFQVHCSSVRGRGCGGGGKAMQAKAKWGRESGGREGRDR